MEDAIVVVDWLTNGINWLFDQFSYSADFVCNLLPDSPFRLLSYTPIEPYLGVLYVIYAFGLVCLYRILLQL